jgi:hypothetical protein
MAKPTILFHDVSKGEAVEREMTDEEYETYLIRVKLQQKEYEENEARENARQSALAKLASLGLTEDEIAAL